MDEPGLKIIAIIVLWVLSITGGLLPTYTSRSYPRVVSYFNIGTGGIFLSASLIDLLPHAVVSLESYMQESGLPLSYICFSIAFLIIFIVEDLAEHVARVSSSTIPAYASLHLPNELHIHKKNEQNEKTLNFSEDGSSEREDYYHNIVENLDKSQSFILNECAVCQHPQFLKAPIEHSDCPRKNEEALVSMPQGMIVLIALGFHSTMEGLGLGASTEKNTGNIFLAIAAHKLLEAFTLGNMLFKCCSSRMFLWLVIGYSFTAPLGAMCGMLLADFTKGSLAAGVCTALAAGTFMHVATMEVIPMELNNAQDGESRSFKLLALVFGFVGFTSLVLLTG